MIPPENLPLPWHWDVSDFSNELHQEVSKSHVLYGAKVKSIARRQDMDDFLFQVENRDYQYAVVHLTWKRPDSNPWPITKIFKDWDDVFNNKILPDSKGWEDEE